MKYLTPEYVMELQAKIIELQEKLLHESQPMHIVASSNINDNGRKIIGGSKNNRCKYMGHSYKSGVIVRAAGSNNTAVFLQRLNNEYDLAESKMVPIYTTEYDAETGINITRVAIRKVADQLNLPIKYISAVARGLFYNTEIIQLLKAA